MEGHIWLIGMMGAGKSTVGRQLATRLGIDHHDTDEEISARTGCSVAQLWGARGERAFRDLEAATIGRLAGTAPSVISTGGGVVLDPANVARMRESGMVVWLIASPATLAARVGNGRSRPLLTAADSAERLGEILEQRGSLYAEAAEAVISTDGVPVGVVVERIEELWNG
jgi:shikimate kinase